MKSNIIKYIFIVFIVGIVIFAIYFLYSQSNKEENETKTEVENKVESSIITNLRLGISSFDNINPIVSKNKEILNLSTLLFDPLLKISSDYKVEYCLAKEIAKSDDTTYVVKLNDNLKWSDGTAVTATDVQFTVNKLKEGNSNYSENVARVKNVEIVDNTTVKIYLDKKVPFFEYNLTFPIISSAQYNENDISTGIPLSTGMYKISEITDEKIELIKNENWRNIGTTELKLDNITIKIYKSVGEIFNAFKLGNIDIVNTSLTNIQDYVGTMGYNKKEYKGREYDFLALNCEDTILQYKEVRQAISYAIDREYIIANVYNNTKTVADFPIDYGHYLYSEDAGKHSYDTQKAREILEDAGWTYRYGEWRKTENYRTRTIDLTIVVDSTDENRVKIAKLIEEQLEDIGINVYVNEVTKAGYERRLEQKDYEIILTGIYSSYNPDLSYFYGDDNLANFENEEMTSLLNDINNISDINLLTEKYKRIVEIAIDDSSYIGLSRNKNIVIYSQKLIGDISPNNYTTYYNVQNWYRQ